MRGAIELFVRTYDARNTRNNYRHVLRGFAEWCSTHDVDPLAPKDSDIERYLEASKPQRGYRTSVLRSFYRFLDVHRLVAQVPGIAAREKPERLGIHIVRGLQNMEVAR